MTQSPQHPIIWTKLRPPFTRQELVPRPRLMAQVERGLGGPLTLLTAPAGFGKTSLAAACVSGCGLPAAWLSLDENDNHPAGFLRYLIAALQEAGPGIGEQAAQLLAAPQQVGPQAILTSLINDLERMGLALVLVLDDYQHIRSQAVHEALAFLLEHPPSGLHVLIATRSDPPLPTARMRARGQLVELRAGDLRFTQAESAQFLNEIMDLRLDEGSVAALEARTEGWIAGLQMAALSMRSREDISGFIENFSGTNRFILDFLLEEVLANQPPEIQRFLLQTAVLDRLTADLCDAVLAGDDLVGSDPAGDGLVVSRATDLELPAPGQSAANLEYLGRENLFLLSLDEERGWFRYHHLFGDMLRARLGNTWPDLPPILHRRAAKWFEGRGIIPEAISHLFAAREVERAADLIERYGPALLVENDPAVMQLADRLPEEAVLARPVLSLHLAWLAIIGGRIPQAVGLLNAIAQGMGPNPTPRWVQTVASLGRAFLAPPGDPRGAVPLPDFSLLAEIPASAPILQNAADYLYVMALGRRGELDRAVEAALQCIQREKESAKTGAVPTLTPFLSRITLILGRLHAAHALCREHLAQVEARDIPLVHAAGSMKIDLGEVLYEWDQLEEAEVLVRAGLRENETWGNIMTEGFGLAALTRLLLAKGDTTGAMQTFKRFETRLREGSTPIEFEEDLRTLGARLQLASGDLQGVSRWADQVEQSDGYASHEGQYRLTLARIRLAQGRTGEVERLLAGTTPPVAAGSQVARQIETNLLLAAAVYGQERPHEAFALVERSLSLAEPEGYVRVFLGLGKAVQTLLADYLRSEAACHRSYAQKLLAAFPALAGAGTDSLQPGGLIEALTGRELEVLHLLAQGMTNKAIAGQLFVAPGTVKAHAASIYRKLEAANRTEAVARARQLGVLP